MLTPALLTALLHVCAPNVEAHTEAAVVAVDSGGDAWVLHDNTTGRAFAPRTYQEAVRVGTRLLADGHSVDVGLTQINSRNFTAYHVSLIDMLDPCANLRVGSAILTADYRRQWTQTADVPATIRPQVALRRALQEYNSGSPMAAPAYTDAIIHALDSRLVTLTAGPNTITLAPSESEAQPVPSRTPAPHAVATPVSSEVFSSPDDPTPIPDPTLLRGRASE